jgi:hypothetical protein
MRVALLALTLAASALIAAPAGAAERAPVPQLDWKDCDDGFQCATAKVPLDHTRPHGRTIEIALVRSPATDSEHRIGSLFMNPGGIEGGDLPPAGATCGQEIPFAIQPALSARRSQGAGWPVAPTRPSA